MLQHKTHSNESLHSARALAQTLYFITRLIYICISYFIRMHHLTRRYMLDATHKSACHALYHRVPALVIILPDILSLHTVTSARFLPLRLPISVSLFSICPASHQSGGAIECNQNGFSFSHGNVPLEYKPKTVHWMNKGIKQKKKKSNIRAHTIHTVEDWEWKR